MNICTFRGRLTDAPEFKLSGENKISTARFTLAVPDRTKKNAEGKFDADFIRISTLGKIADVLPWLLRPTVTITYFQSYLVPGTYEK